MTISNIAFGISILAFFISSINMGLNIARRRYLSSDSKYSHLNMKEIQHRIRIFTFVFGITVSALILGLIFIIALFIDQL